MTTRRTFVAVIVASLPGIARVMNRAPAWPLHSCRIPTLESVDSVTVRVGQTMTHPWSQMMMNALARDHCLFFMHSTAAGRSG